MHFPGPCRSVTIQPVSDVLSSQVTNISDTSPDIAVQFTLQYLVNVSFYTCNYIQYNYGKTFMYYTGK